MLFVENYLRTGEAEASALRAGYARASANTTANQLIYHNEDVKFELAKARRSSEKRATYNYEAAMDECDQAIEFAKSKANANAYVKALEIKAKLSGLLIEKHEVKHAGFSIQISGITDDVRDVKPLEAALDITALIGGRDE